jgi:hypothetical protein
MAKTTISLALILAIGHLTSLSSAQPMPAQRTNQPPPPAQPVAVDASTRASVAAPNAAATPGAAAVAPSPSAADGAAAPAPNGAASASAAASTPGMPMSESTVPQQPTIQNQPDAMNGAAMPSVVGSPHPLLPRTESRTYEHQFTVTVDVASVLWRTGRGYDLFSTNDAAWRVALGLGYDLAKLTNQMVLSLDIGAQFEPERNSNNDGLLGNTLSGSLSAATFLLGGSVRWAVTPWLAPYGRLQLLTSRYAVDIQTAAANVTAGTTSGEWSYHRWAHGGALGAGVMLNMPPKSLVSVGLLVEGGYWLQQSVDLVLEKDLPTGAIATAGAPVGSLGNSGPYLRCAGVLRF